MKMLVTGGLGFLGSHVAHQLATAGHEVTVLDDASRGQVDNLTSLDRDVPVVRGDVRDASALRQHCADTDVVLHLAAVQGTGTFYREPERVLDVNVGGTLEVVRACALAGVRRLVFASSSEIYATPLVVPTPEEVAASIPDVTNPRFSYSGSKIIGELLAVNYARRHGFDYTILRYHNVYGPRMGWDHVIPQFIARLEREEAFTVQGDGRQTRAFCFVSDAADATVRAATTPAGANQIFNIGNPEREWTINELISLLGVVSGRAITPQYVGAAEGGTPRRCPDITRAQQRLGYEPKVPLREGLALTYQWYADAIERESAPR